MEEEEEDEEEIAFDWFSNLNRLNDELMGNNKMASTTNQLKSLGNTRSTLGKAPKMLASKPSSLQSPTEQKEVMLEVASTQQTKEWLYGIELKGFFAFLASFSINSATLSFMQVMIKAQDQRFVF